MIDDAIRLSLTFNSSSIRPAHRSSIVLTPSTVARLAGGPPAFNHVDTVCGCRPISSAMSMIDQPARRNATTSMNSSCVIIKRPPPVLSCLAAREAGGVLTLGSASPAGGTSTRYATSNFSEHLSRTSVSADTRRTGRVRLALLAGGWPSRRSGSRSVLAPPREEHIGQRCGRGRRGK